MTEKILHLEGIDPTGIYGINNVNLDFLKQTYPKIQIIARGHDLKLMGDAINIVDFEEKFKEILEFFDKYNRLSTDDLKEILTVSPGSQIAHANDADDIIVFGNNGKPIRARTINQQKLVKEAYKNDLVFALGPAGTGKTYTAIALAVRGHVPHQQHI